MTSLTKNNLTDSWIKYKAVSMNNEKTKGNNWMSNNISDSAMKGAATGALIGALFGPQGIVIGAAVGGIVEFILDE